MVTVGRVGFLDTSPDLGPASRYTTLTLLGVVGLYRCSLALNPERLRALAAGAIAALIFVGIFSTLDTSYPAGTEARRQRREMREALLVWRTKSDDVLASLYPDGAEVRQRAAVLERLRLSVFRDGPADAQPNARMEGVPGGR